MAQYFPKYSLLALYLLVFILLIYYPFWDSFLYSLQGTHIWRQADCLSISSSYAIYDNPFLETRTLNLGLSGNGKTVSDFPLIYWFTSLFYGSSGFETIYRILVFLFWITGITLFFKTIEGILRNSVFSLLAVLMLFTSPALMFYSNNYLMNMPALSLSLMSYWFIYRYWNNGNKTHLMAWFALLVFASLLKITALIHCFIVVLPILIYHRRDIVSNKKIKSLLIVALLILLIDFAWISYARHYNDINNSGIFLTGTLPIWDINSSSISPLFKEIYGRSEDLFNPIFLFATVLILIWVLLGTLFKKKHQLLGFTLITYSLGFIGYFLLFFQVLNDHDYYFINWIPLFTVVPIVGIFYLVEKTKMRLILSVLLLVLLVDSAENCHNRLHDKYDNWKNEFYTSYIVDFESAMKDDNFPIFTKEDKIYVPSDPTINATLFTLRSQGWTAYNELDLDNRMAKILKFGLTHVILHKKSNHQENSKLQSVIQNMEIIYDSDRLAIYSIPKE